MKLRTKLFLAIFGTAVGASLVTLVAAYYSRKESRFQEYAQENVRLVALVGESMQRAEAASEMIAANAIRYLSELDRKQGLLSEAALKEFTRKMHVAHAYITDRSGKYLRSTYNSVNEIPNIFSFCEGYRKLIDGTGRIEQTPLIPSEPYLGPFKYTMMANHDGSRILDIGMSMSFVEKLLPDAVRTNANIRSIGVYTPTGYRLGSLEPNGRLIEGGSFPVTAPQNDSVEVREGKMIVTKRVAANQTECCECVNKKVARPGEPYHYIVRAELTLETLSQYAAQLRWELFLAFLGCGVLCALLAQWLSGVLLRRFEAIRTWMSSVVNQGALVSYPTLKGHDEINDLADDIHRMTLALDESRGRLARAERSREVAELASQVAHDIRSPLTALEVATEYLSGVPENIRVLVRQSITRIHDIAAHLLQVQRRASDSMELRPDTEVAATPVASLLEAITEEKRMEYAQRSVTILLQVEPAARGAFAMVNGDAFKRIISNLVNNAVEALDDGGTVTLGLSVFGGELKLEIADDGKGISSDVLPHLMERGYSSGKSEGSGLGLHHAKINVEAWGGFIRMESTVGKGTRVSLYFPSVAAPEWFPSSLSVGKGTTVVVVDDDKSVHLVWDLRFRDKLRSPDRLVHLDSPEALRDWCAAGNGRGTKDVLFLVDYEYGGNETHGLDLIRELGIERRSVLVTSRHEDRDLPRRCLDSGIKLLPKDLARHVVIRSEN